MRRRNNKFLYLIIIFMFIGFAYLSTTLTINGRGILAKNSWKIYFDNVNVKKGSEFASVLPTTVGKSTTDLSFEVSLLKPGDEFEFTAQIVNDGSIDAMIEMFYNGNLTEEQLSYVDYTVEYIDGYSILERQLLDANSFDIIKVYIAYKKDITPEIAALDKEPVDFNIGFNFEIADETAFERDRQYTKLIDGASINYGIKKWGEDLGLYVQVFEEVDLYDDEEENDSEEVDLDYFHFTPISERNLEEIDSYSFFDDYHYLISYSAHNCDDQSYDYKDGEEHNICERKKKDLFLHKVEYKLGYFYLDSIIETKDIPAQYRNDKYRISTDDSFLPVYAWIDDGTVYFGSEANKIYFNEDSDYMFYNSNYMSSIYLPSYSTKLSESMNYFFSGSNYLTSVVLGDFDTRNVTSMDFLFQATNIPTLDYSKFNTSKVTSMHSMFRTFGDNNVYVEPISKLDTSNVTDMTNMFFLYRGNLDLTHFNTRNVVEMDRMFYAVEASFVDLSSFYFKPNVDVRDMFQSATVTTIYVGENYLINNMDPSVILGNLHNHLVGGNGTLCRNVNSNDIRTAYPDGYRFDYNLNKWVEDPTSIGCLTFKK